MRDGDRETAEDRGNEDGAEDAVPQEHVVLLVKVARRDDRARIPGCVRDAVSQTATSGANRPVHRGIEAPVSSGGSPSSPASSINDQLMEGNQ
jgi:hypothetical protein